MRPAYRSLQTRRQDKRDAEIQAAFYAPRCECNHRECEHAPVDYDSVGDPLRFRAVPRKCLVPGCDCTRFEEEGLPF